MLIFSEVQLEAFQVASIDRFKSRMALLLTDNFCDKVAAQSEFELNMLISKSIEKAEVFGIDTEDDVQVFLLYVMQLGLDFGMKYSWSRQILNNDDLLGSEKMEQLDLIVQTEFPEFKFYNEI